MKELMIHIGVGVEIMTFITSLLLYPKYKHTVLKYFPFYLGFIVFLEIFCMFFYRVQNVWLFNILYILEFNFLAFIYWHYFNRFNRKVLLAFLVVFNSLTLVTCVVGAQNFFVEPIFYTYVLASFSHISLIILLFNQMLRSNTGLEEIFRNLLFWICLGLLIFFATTLPVQTIRSWKETLGEFRHALFYILFSAVLLKNLLFIFGFLWSKKIFTY